VAHVLDARADDGVVHPGRDQRGAEVDRLLRGAALAVDRRGGRLDRQAGLQPGVAADVEALLAVLLHAPCDHIVDGPGGDAGALDDLRVALRQELVRVDVRVDALLRMTAPDRRADRLDDDDLATVALMHGGAFRPSFEWDVP
jgi:hypothetical protein